MISCATTSPANRPRRREVLPEAAGRTPVELLDGAPRQGNEIGDPGADFVEDLHHETLQSRVRRHDVHQGRTRVPGPHEPQYPVHGRMQGRGPRVAGERDRRERLAGRRERRVLEVRVRRGEDEALLERPRVPADQAGGVPGDIRERHSPTVRTDRRERGQDPIDLHLAHRFPFLAETRLDLTRSAREAVSRDRPARFVDDGTPTGSCVGRRRNACASDAVQLAVQHALLAPAERPEDQAVVLRRMARSANHPSGNAGKVNLPSPRLRPRGVDGQGDRGTSPVADSMEPAPVTRPDRKPQPVPGEVDRVSCLPALVHAVHLQAQ